MNIVLAPRRALLDIAKLEPLSLRSLTCLPLQTFKRIGSFTGLYIGHADGQRSPHRSDSAVSWHTPNFRTSPCWQLSSFSFLYHGTGGLETSPHSL